jgi:hypothetical protein
MATDDPSYFVCPGCGSTVDVRRSDVVYATAKADHEQTRPEETLEAAEAYFHSHCFRDHRQLWRAARRPDDA